ncbi:MAG: high-potential iron-sulfur protein [Flavobacteriales bacterium]|nr:high-potential iron-sulfur protein [Flavobacteriales bacterium]
MEKLSRKEFLKRAGIFGLSAVAGTTLLAACGGGGAESSGSEESTTPPPKPQPKPESMSADCSEYNKDLSEADLSTRESLQYVAMSEKEGENCMNCQFYQPDKFEGNCGGCQLFANGAVSPKGYCISWSAKQPA